MTVSEFYETDTYPRRNLRLKYEHILEKTVNIQELNNVEFILTLKDGRDLLYNDIGQTLRELPPDKNNMTEEECLSEFGERLFRVMCRTHINQLMLSERTGIPQPVLSRYMTGKSCPSFYKVDKIVKVLGCSMDELRYY